MTFTDNPARDYERFCDAQDHGAGDEPSAGGDESLDARASADFLRGFARGLAGEPLLKRGEKPPQCEATFEDLYDGWNAGREESLAASAGEPPEGGTGASGRVDFRPERSFGEVLDEFIRLQNGAGDEYEPPEGGEGSLERVEDEALCELESAVAHASLRLEARASAALAAVGDEEGWGSVPEERGKWVTNCMRDAKLAATVFIGVRTLQEELAWRECHVEGPPKETEWYTREELERFGYVGFYERVNANPRGKFWDSEEPVRHEELYREDLEEPQDVL